MTGGLAAYLRNGEVIDRDHPAVSALAEDLAKESSDSIAIARACFEWVRDRIRHSHDHKLDPVTCTASEVLLHQTGYCYAKSHLLAALLRANGIPAGLCYQRLSRDDNGPPFVLHGLVAAHLPGTGWYRLDARGNRPGINARFDPPTERLAYRPRIPGEADLPEVWPEPLPIVVATLRSCATWREVWERLPDVEIIPSARR